MKKKQKRFYSNDKRGQKWTEPEVGRPIDFADKYIEPRTQAGQAELDRERRKKGPAFQKTTPGQVVRRVLLVLLGLVLLYAGYILMDAWMDLHAMPAAQTDTVDGNTISTVALEAKATKVDSLSLDGAVMLDAMMDDLSSGGYTAACFDIKRADGTVGYASTLGTVAAAGAVFSPAGDLRSSCQKLGKNDLLVLGHIVCYPDNVQTAANPAWAVKSGKTAYTDPAGNRYLNPDSTEVYNYIRSLVEESVRAGVTVFVLEGTELPQAAGTFNHNGFADLSKRLTADLGQDVKFLQPVAVNITSTTTADLKKEVADKCTQNPNENQIYAITCPEKSRRAVKQLLDDRGCTCYLITE